MGPPTGEFGIGLGCGGVSSCHEYHYEREVTHVSRLWEPTDEVTGLGSVAVLEPVNRTPYRNLEVPRQFSASGCSSQAS
jgi:hypothetical protein